MLFHVTAKHNYKTCPGVQHGVDSDAVRDMTSWMEGNSDVKVIGVWGYNVSHTIFAVIEADDMQLITSILRPQMAAGDVQVLPVMDSIAIRKERGHWAN